MRCTSCPIGRYSSVDGATFCSVCDGDTYQVDTGKSSCDACDVGKYILSASSEPLDTDHDQEGDCQECHAGKINSGSQCVNCPAGTYRADGSPLCTNCGEGTSSAAGAAACTVCVAGKRGEIGRGAQAASVASAGSVVTCKKAFNALGNSLRSPPNVALYDKLTPTTRRSLLARSSQPKGTTRSARGALHAVIVRPERRAKKSQSAVTYAVLESIRVAKGNRHAQLAMQVRFRMRPA